MKPLNYTARPMSMMFHDDMLPTIDFDVKNDDTGDVVPVTVEIPRELVFSESLSFTEVINEAGAMAVQALPEYRAFVEQHDAQGE